MYPTNNTRGGRVDPRREMKVLRKRTDKTFRPVGMEWFSRE